jgi:predicted MPP superfamily phosphohydrolase
MPNATLIRSVLSSLGGLAVAGGLFAGYASRIEPQWAETVRLTLPLPNLPPGLDGLTIAQISDLHAGNAIYAQGIRRYVEMTNALGADVTVTTGDMFHHGPRAAQMCAAELSALRAPLGVYAVMGNHERRLPARQGEAPFHRAGLTVLCNAAQRIPRNGSALWLVGLDDVLLRRGDLSLALRGVPKEDCKILLVHEPDFADQAAQNLIDLQLSGHTHGGQIRLPGIGPLMLPILGRNYPMGLYRVRHTWVYTNRGLGMARPSFRFCCRPEITLFTLQSMNGRPWASGRTAHSEER